MCHPAMDPTRDGALRKLLLTELQWLVDTYYELANWSSKWIPALPQDLEDLCCHLDQYENVPWAYKGQIGEENADAEKESEAQQLVQNADC